MYQKLRPLLLALALCFIPGFARATAVVPMTLTELVMSSDAVIFGVVDDVTVQLNDVGEPWTSYQLRSARALKGSLESKDTFQLLCFGGEVDGRASHVDGVPSFEVGDEVIVFWREQNELCQVTGWNQGVLFITLSADGEPVWVDGDGREIVGMGATDLLRVGGEAEGDPLVRTRAAEHNPSGGRPTNPRVRPSRAMEGLKEGVIRDIQRFAATVRKGRSPIRTRGTIQRARPGHHVEQEGL